MKQNKILSSILVYTMIFVFMISISAFSVRAMQLPVNLGTAGDFAILSKAGISTTGTTSIVGDIGVSPIDHTAITGFNLVGVPANDVFLTSALVTGKIYSADLVPPTPSNIGTSVSNMETAFTDAQGRTTDGSPEDTTELGAGDISGMTILPGLHKWSSGVLINAGGSGDPNGVTLNCQGNSSAVFIFQIAQDLTVGNGAKITLIGNCQASNIFWAVDGGVGVAIGTTAHVEGNILASKAIMFNTGASLNGRALAQTAVTLDANAIVSPGATLPTPVLTTITLLPASANLIVGSTYGYYLQLNATSLDQFNLPFATTIVYNSSNLSVATVDVNGNITAVAPGIATIIAYSNNISNSTNITVNVAPTSNPSPSANTHEPYTTTSVPLSVITSQNATCRYDITDIPYNNMTLNFTDNVTQHNAVYTVSSGTSYTLYVRCNDVLNNTDNTSTIISFSVDSAPPAPVIVVDNGNGGGSGGGSSGIDYSQCADWSTCNSDGVQTKICTYPGSNTTLTKKQSCDSIVLPTVPTTPKPPTNVESPVIPTTPTNQVTPTNNGNQITGQAVSQSDYQPTWWNRFWSWVSRLFGGK